MLLLFFSGPSTGTFTNWTGPNPDRTILIEADPRRIKV